MEMSSSHLYRKKTLALNTGSLCLLLLHQRFISVGEETLKSVNKETSWNNRRWSTDFKYPWKKKNTFIQLLFNFSVLRVPGTIRCWWRCLWYCLHIEKSAELQDHIPLFGWRCDVRAQYTCIPKAVLFKSFNKTFEDCIWKTIVTLVAWMRICRFGCGWQLSCCLKVRAANAVKDTAVLMTDWSPLYTNAIIRS